MHFIGKQQYSVWALLVDNSTAYVLYWKTIAQSMCFIDKQKYSVCALLIKNSTVYVLYW